MKQILQNLMLFVAAFLVATSMLFAAEGEKEKKEPRPVVMKEETDPANTKAANSEPPPPPPVESESRLTDKNIPLQIDAVPTRPGPLLEFPQHFLGTGPIDRGFTIPGGAVWQPYFMLYGTLRTGVQTFEPGTAASTQRLSEWANRLDLFGNLYLTFTERIVVGVRPLDRDGRFTSYTFQPTPPSGVDAFNSKDINGEITTLFFEGDFGELFPDLDPHDRHGLDYGFAVGRQMISFQEGMLINDNLDAVGITKINWKIFSSINFRWTLLFGWNQVNRFARGNFRDNDAQVFGLFTESDYRNSTYAFDAVVVNAKDTTGKGIYAGFSAVQRWGGLNTSFRILGSAPIGKERLANTRGLLLFSEISWTPHGGDNFVYINAFLGIDRFRSAARDSSVGGPLAPRAGVLFASVGLGRYGAPLSTLADNATGGAIGYQFFFNGARQQLILELGGRYSKEEVDQTAAAFDATFQTAVGSRFVFRVDGFAAYVRGFSLGGVTVGDKVRSGGRFEILVQF